MSRVGGFNGKNGAIVHDATDPVAFPTPGCAA